MFIEQVTLNLLASSVVMSINMKMDLQLSVRFMSRRVQCASTTLVGLTVCVSLLYLNKEDKNRANACPNCDVYEPSRNFSHKYDCVKTRFQPPIVMCIYPIEEDIRISYSLKESGTWELAMVQVFQKWLADDPEIGFIDVGANLGVYTLLASAMGHQTVAIEANIRTLFRLGASINANRLDPGSLTVLRNAVGDKRGIVNVIRSRDNQGDTRVSEGREGWNRREQVNMIVLDDITGFCEFHEAVMKVDIQGYEHKAFVAADQLFDVIRIYYVIMEMRELLLMTRTQHPGSRDIMLIENMIDFFRVRGYTPRDLSGSDLNHMNWRQWPDDVIWGA